MKSKRKDQNCPEKREQFLFNLRKIEQASLEFLNLACRFVDIRQMLIPIKHKLIVGRPQRDQSAPKKDKLVHEKAPATEREKEEDSDKGGGGEDCADMSFLIENERHTSVFSSISGVIGDRIAKEGLDTTSGFLSSDDEGEPEIQGVTREIEMELLKKDFKDFSREFNEICLILFCENLKNCVSKFQTNPKDFAKAHFKSKNLELQSKPKVSELSNRILSESMQLESPNFRRMTTEDAPGRETQMNRELAEQYREQHKKKGDKWVECVFWGFFASSVFILILFFVLFYCNVFSSN